MKKNQFLILFLLLYISVPVFSQITGVEYWFENKPFNMFTENITPDADGYINFQVKPSHLPTGLNSMSFRVKDALGRVSPVETHWFFKSGDWSLIGLKYWFDDSEERFTVNLLDIAEGKYAQLQTNHLSSGFHKLYYTLINGNGDVSAVHTQHIFKSPYTGELFLTYWIDDDKANAKSLPISKDALVNLSIDVSQYPKGSHRINYTVNAKDGTITSVGTEWFTSLDPSRYPTDGGNVEKFRYWFNDSKEFAQEIEIENPALEVDFEADIEAYGLMNGENLLNYEFINTKQLTAYDEDDFENIGGLPEQIVVEQDEKLASISPKLVSEKADVFYYYHLKRENGTPVKGASIVLSVNEKEIIGTPSDENGLAMVWLPIYGEDYYNLLDDIIPVGRIANISVKEITDMSHKYRIPVSNSSSFLPTTLKVNLIRPLDDLSLKIKGGVAAEAGWNWAKLGFDIDLSLKSKFSFENEKISKIKVNGAVDLSGEVNLHTPKTIEAAKLEIEAGAKMGAFAEFEFSPNLGTLSLLVKNLMMKSDNSESPSVKLAIQVLDDLVKKYGSDVNLKSGTGDYIGFFGGMNIGLFQGGLDLGFKNKDFKYLVKLPELGAGLSAGVTYSTINTKDYKTNENTLIDEVSVDIEGEYSFQTANEKFIDKRLSILWDNIYPNDINEILGGKIKEIKGDFSKSLSFSQAVATNPINGSIVSLESTMESKKTQNFGLSGETSLWMNFIKNITGVSGGAKQYRKDIYELKSNGTMAYLINSAPSVKNELFPIENKIAMVNKQYDLFSGKVKMPTELMRVANPPASYIDMGIDKDLTFTQSQNLGMDFYIRFRYMTLR